MLWILAGVSIALLIYEAGTLITAVLLPLLDNPNAIQTDFHYYYDAAVRFRGDPLRLYRLSDDVIAGFAYPPPAILPFVVLSYLPLGASLLVFTLISYGVLAAAIASWLSYLRSRGLTIESTTAMAAAVIALALGPSYSNAIFGQVNALVLACAVGFMTIGPRRPEIGGSLLAAGIWLKIYPVLMAAIGLWNRSAWRRLLYAIAASAVLVLVLRWTIPPASYVTFVTDVLPARFDKTAVHITNQSLVAFLERFFVPPERFLNWTGDQAIAVSGIIRGFNWMFGVAVILLLWRRATHGPRVEAIDSAAGVIALAAVIAPLGWGHTFVLVLPLVILHLVSLRDASPVHQVIVFLCVLAMMVPPGRRFSLVEQLMPWAQNVFYSRYLLAALVLIALPPAIAPYTDSRR
ncbi:MAG TPA: glycosyltransferase family 87 protein [Vicinamibacterales bacterium]|nr:glycosyltransferase family 87 protein [Vicinamibacterales bacterium]